MKLPKGIYYIGDPFYSIAVNEWDSFIKDTIDNPNSYFLHEYKNSRIACKQTKLKEVYYIDNNREYTFYVPKGILSIIPIELIHDDIIKDIISDNTGILKEYHEDFYVYYNNDVFRLGDIIIDCNTSTKVCKTA